MQLDSSVHSPSLENSSLSDHALPDRSQFLKALAEEGIHALSAVSDRLISYDPSAEPAAPEGAGSKPGDKGQAPHTARLSNLIPVNTGIGGLGTPHDPRQPAES
jgi:hypothetical protein